MRSTQIVVSARSNGLGYEFEVSSSGGALLILPEGAAQYDLRNRRLFFDAATRHGADWYRFAEAHLGRMIPQDALYLITGFYKTRSWSLAAFEHVAGRGDVSVQFTMAQVGGGNIARAYTWAATHALDWRVGPIDHYGIPNQSVFIRGFKIALRADFLGKTRIDVKVGAPDTHAQQERFSHTVTRDSWISKVWRGLSKGSHHGTDMQEEASTGSATDRAGDDTASGGPPIEGGSRVVVQSVPEPSQACALFVMD